MASLRQGVLPGGVCFWCCVISLCLHALLHVTSATDVIRFGQGKSFNKHDDSDNIYDMLEDEHFVIADTKLSRGRKPHVTRTATRGDNASLPLPKSPPLPSYTHPRGDSDQNSVGVSASPSAAAATSSTPDAKLRTISTPGMHQSAGHTTHAGAEEAEVSRLSAFDPEDVEDDFLLFAEEREMVERAEEERRRQEHELALRVKRAAPQEASGYTPVNVKLTTTITWIENFRNENSQDYKDLSIEAEREIQSKLGSLSFNITGFEQNTTRQGSTVILFDVEYEMQTVNETELVELARALLQFMQSGIVFRGISYSVPVDPLIDQDDIGSGTYQAATCFLCAPYQSCAELATTGTYTCQISSIYFFAFGQNQEDQTMVKDRKRQSVVFKVQGRIPVGDRLIKKVAVSMNGLISFGRKYNSFSPKPLPRGDRKLLCGYWSDFLLSSRDSRSNVWYHVYEKTDNTPAADVSMLTEGRMRVETYSGVENFDPTFMLVATYEMIPPDPSDPSTAERVNFQMMVITDGFTTYAMVIYASGGMLWDSEIGRDVTIGYLDVNFDIDVSTPGGVVGNTNQVGVWFFRLGSVSDNPTQSCLNWYYLQLPSLPQYRAVERWMPGCPCNYRVMLLSFAYSPYSLQDGVICFMLNWPFLGHGKTCCYRAPGILVRSRPYAGTFLQHHPSADPAGHYMQDELAKDWCCFQSNLCNKYYRVRPSSTCLRFIFIIIAFGRGDPHITTLDGHTFPFNAIGEFTLFKVDQPPLAFELQGRTCQATNKDEVLVAASVFCALVVNYNNDTLQVELSLDKKSLVVYINDQDVTLDYRDDGNNFLRTAGSLMVRRSNDTLRATFVTFESGVRMAGISLNVTVGFQLLTYELSIENPQFNGTTGLMGNMDGNPNNDFVFPNGTTLPNDTSERDLLAYGKTWAVNNDTTLFKYYGGKTFESYINDSFVPIFLSEVDQTVKTEAENVCGGSSDIGCVFDYIATQNKALAQGTKLVMEQTDANKESATNSIPEVTGPQQIRVVVGVQYNFTLNASDAEDANIPVYSFNDQPSTLVFDNATQTAVYTPTNETAKIEAVVQDTSGATSPALKIEIALCSGCNNRGTCNYTVLIDGEEEYFKKATCDCEPYYSGDDCQDNFDACAEDPCPLLTHCTDLSPEDHMSQRPSGTGYNCSGCPTGYTLNVTNGDPTCYDVDECQNESCDQICANTQGSFLCSCHSGYRLSSQDATVCNDINECTDNTDNCEQVCENTAGGFNCSCMEGFLVNATTDYTCDKVVAQDPCLELNASCSYGCQNVSGQAQCICPSGYRLDNQTHCTDIDECLERICSQKCSNSDGGYTCSCFPGYERDKDKITCNACPANYYGEGCSQICDCRGRGSCDSVRGCQCQTGWTGIMCDQDVDECETLVKPCADKQTCANTNGSYVCNCPKGYSKVNNSLCEDINECADPSLRNCTQVCTNTVGSSVCSCNTGYNYDNAANTCVDIDECDLGISQCEQQCVNFNGSANCVCESGFVLNDDRKTCTKQVDPCDALSQTKNCSYRCENVNGTAQCRCQIGYQLGTDGVSCIDIKECDSNATNNCSRVGGQCQETLGSYLCKCDAGYKLENDQRTCTVCDEYHWGPDCAQECNCHPLNTERCDPQQGCVCKSGWLGSTCDQDRDDCLSNPCPASKQCVNLPGSFRCDCLPGFVQDNDTAPCEDVNECTSNPCDQSCNNTVGSYVCSCDDGFLLEGDKCSDINECQNNNLCDQLCRNTLGGYFCECFAGYLLNTTTRTTCYAKTKCTDANPCEQDCAIDNNGNETCTCSAGYVVNSTNSSACDDVDECDQNPCVNGTCTNFGGGFNCSCSDGTYLLGNGVTCKKCPNNTYGANCASRCSCASANTASCDPVDGTCTCSAGWKETECTVDIDECADTPNICDNVSSSTCVNTNGSHVCQCDIGFSASGSQCLPCDDVHYGQECVSLCPCLRSNTLDCHDVTGACTCKSGWKDDNCTEDVDECTGGLNNCSASVHEVCRDFGGGHSCDCLPGYARPMPESSCSDIKECLDPGLNPCDLTKEDCVEQQGNVTCVCKSGYQGSPGACTATYVNITLTVTLAWSPTHLDTALLNKIQNALALFFSRSIGPSFHALLVIKLRRGSVLVDTQVQVDANQTDNPEGLTSRAVEKLLTAGQLEVEGVNYPVNLITISGQDFDGSHTVCENFNALKDCAEEEVCRVNNEGVPSCSPDNDDSDLIIGLGVGIPLFFIAAIVIGAVIYMCVKRRKSSASSEDQRADTSEHRFPSIFAGQVATKGSWGAAQRYHMYSPDNMSVSHGSDSSGEGQLLKGRRQGRSDFQDSAWYDNRGGASASAIPSPRREGEEPAGTEAATSNFSWEYMFRLLQPYRDGLEIQRPNVDPVPNPAYTPRPGGPRPDSMA